MKIILDNYINNRYYTQDEQKEVKLETRETKLAVKIRDKGFRQKWLSEQIGVTQAALSYYANGLRIPPAILERLAEILDCEPSELVGYAEEVTAE